MHIPFRAIVAFHAVATGGSVSKAAAELGVTPSAVSQQVLVLESHLGAALFTRAGRGVRMTETGERYFELIADEVDRIAEATQRIRGYNAVTVLTVRAPPTLATKWLRPALPSFLDAHPHLEVRLDATNEPTDFAHEGIDVEIRHGEGRWPGLFVEGVAEERILPLCAPALAAEGALTPRALLDHRLIHSIKSLAQWGAWFEGVGVTPDTRWRRILFDRSHMAIDAAADGLGVALESHLTAWREIRDGRLICPVAGPPDVRIVSQWLVCPRQNLRLSKVKAFVEWLTAGMDVWRATGAPPGVGGPAPLVALSAGARPQQTDVLSPGRSAP